MKWNSTPSEQSEPVVYPYCDYHYHYWFHIGEAHAIRQQLGHPDLPQFVGDMSKVLYQVESSDV